MQEQRDCKQCVRNVKRTLPRQLCEQDKLLDLKTGSPAVQVGKRVQLPPERR